jgi:hypothetical protein
MASHKIFTITNYPNTKKNFDDEQSQSSASKNVAENVGSCRKPYICNICVYNTYKKSNYDKHLSSIKHKNNFSINNNLFNCDSCGYTTQNKSYYDNHLMSIKHKMNIAYIKSKKVYQYNCNTCNYHTDKKYNYDKHILSNNHVKMIENTNTNETVNENENTNLNSNTLNDDAITSIMTEIKCLMVEQNKMFSEQTKMNKIITEIANKPTNIQNNNQTNNQQFNLNVYLNETCKDAMNLSEFLENLHVSMEDMEKTGELGFAKGMSRIIMNNLNAIDVCKRPIHCSDVKRETLYVKNNGVWEKETEERKRTKEIIYKVSCLNEKQLIKWRDLPRNKGYDKSDHKKNDEFTNLVMEINKLREEEINKVITSVSRHVAIDKERVKMSGYLN